MTTYQEATQAALDWATERVRDAMRRPSDEEKATILVGTGWGVAWIPGLARIYDEIVGGTGDHPCRRPGCGEQVHDPKVWPYCSVGCVVEYGAERDARFADLVKRAQS